MAIFDAAGYIVFTNEALTTAFKQEGCELAGKRYVDLFMIDIPEGRAMRKYIELFEEEASEVKDFDTKFFNSETRIKGRITCLGAGANRVLIAVLSIIK